MDDSARAPRVVVLVSLVVLMSVAATAYLSGFAGIGSWVALAAVGLVAVHVRDLKQAGQGTQQSGT